jgi:hypothetical protein
LAETPSFRQGAAAPCPTIWLRSAIQVGQADLNSRAESHVSPFLEKILRYIIYSIKFLQSDQALAFNLLT